MNEIYLNEESISQSFWKNINEIIRTSDFNIIIENIWTSTNDIRQYFPPGVAGTINKQTALELIAISKYFSPQFVCEIGTYIGRSTMCIVAGSENTLKQLHTCDYSFDIFKMTKAVIDFDLNRTKIKYYGKTSSIEMLKQVQSNSNEKIDLFFIDGRITDEDNMLIERIKNDNTIFILDDYEGTEKGVHNAFILRQKFKDLFLIRPSVNLLNTEILLGKLGLLVPMRNFKLSKQQYFPNNVWL
jgi:hypothetical protein